MKIAGRACRQQARAAAAPAREQPKLFEWALSADARHQCRGRATGAQIALL